MPVIACDDPKGVEQKASSLEVANTDHPIIAIFAKSMSFYRPLSELERSLTTTHWIYQSQN